jgi:hypothetical protein
MLRARELTLALLADRAAGATICPSEAARALAIERGNKFEHAWRREMPTIHRAIDDLLATGSIRISWKGRDLSARNGPYRIRRA